MRWLEQMIRKLLFKEKADPQTYLRYLRERGAKIGKGVYIFASPRDVTIDATRPWLLEIGDNVQITKGVTILTHGYDWAVLKGVYGEILGSAGKVTIGNNVFIGMNAIILKGVHIGNNVIIGAGSLVNRDIPDNSVVAGNPARVICDLETYYQKRKAAQIAEATEMGAAYIQNVSGAENPPEGVFYEFFWLYHPRGEAITHPKYVDAMDLVGNRADSDRRFQETAPTYPGYEAFIRHIRESMRADGQPENGDSAGDA